MKWIALLTSFALPLFSSDLACPIEVPETRKIEMIDYENRSEGLRAHIVLTDGSTWKWDPDLYNENLLRKWQQGDEILIRTVNHPGFVLQNLSRPKYLPTVAIAFESYPLYPFIEEISEDRMQLLLCNGSEWELIFDFNVRTLHYWSQGDRIIPVRGLHGEYSLINLDIPYENLEQVERTIQVYKIEIPPPTYEETVEFETP